VDSHENMKYHYGESRRFLQCCKTIFHVIESGFWTSWAPQVLI